MSLKYIAAVGVELEGGWMKRPKDPLHQELSLRCGGTHVGEAVSKPFKSLDVLQQWIEENAPDVVDTTCGFHIHISFKEPPHYNWLTTPRFYKLLLLRIKKWGSDEGIAQTHHFWKRWRGTFKLPHNNRNYCRKEFIPEKQLNNLEKGPEGSVRHCHLNFCKKLHGTIELRLFPGFEKEKVGRYMGAVRCFTSAVEDFIDREKERKTNRIRLRIEPLKVIRRSLWRAA